MKDKLERLRQEARAAMRARREYREMIDEGSEEPASGNLYIFPVELEIALRVALIFTHPDDDELYFALAVDDFMWEGPTDVIVDGHPLGPMVLRANHGLWVPADDVRRARLVGRLDDEMIHRTRRVLSDMVTGDLSPTEKQLETEELEEYGDWIDEIEEAVAALNAWVNRAAVVIDFASLRGKKTDDSAPQRLAAASGGLSGQLRELDDDSGAATLDVERWEGPGSLKLLMENGEVTMVLEAEVDEPPAGQVHFCDGTMRSLEWLSFPGGGLWRTGAFSLNRLSSLSLVQSDGDWMELRLRH